MKKLRLTLAVLMAVVGVINVQAIKVYTHVWSGLQAGDDIVLQCRDTNGGAGQYFNGNDAKSTTLGTANIWTLVAAETPTNKTGSWYYIQRKTDNKYLKGTSGTVQLTENQSEAEKFQITYSPDIAESQRDGWRTFMSNTDKLRLVRFTNTAGNKLNCQQKNSVPQYTGGDGGYSIWYVYRVDEEWLTEGAMYTLQPTDDMNSFLSTTEATEQSGCKTYSLSTTPDYFTLSNVDGAWKLRSVSSNKYLGQNTSISWDCADNSNTTWQILFSSEGLDTYVVKRTGVTGNSVLGWSTTNGNKCVYTNATNNQGWVIRKVLTNHTQLQSTKAYTLNTSKGFLGNATTGEVTVGNSSPTTNGRFAFIPSSFLPNAYYIYSVDAQKFLSAQPKDNDFYVDAPDGYFIVNENNNNSYPNTFHFLSSVTGYRVLVTNAPFKLTTSSGWSLLDVVATGILPRLKTLR